MQAAQEFVKYQILDLKIMLKQHTPDNIDSLQTKALQSLYLQLKQIYPMNYASIFKQGMSSIKLDHNLKTICGRLLRQQGVDPFPCRNQNQGLSIKDYIAKISNSNFSLVKNTMTKNFWTQEQNQKLISLVKQYGAKNWKKIASFFKNRTDVQCLHRWQKALNPQLIKGPWSKEQDDILIEFVMKFGAKHWSIIAKNLPGRIGKQCRQRWHNHLNPNIKKQKWTQSEDQAIIQAQKKFGNQWSIISKFIPGRTDNAIKNHFNSTIKRMLKSSRRSNNTITTCKYNSPQKHENIDNDNINKILFYSPDKSSEIVPCLSIVIPVFSKKCIDETNAKDLIAEIYKCINDCN